MSLFSSLGIPSRKDFLSNIRTVCSGAKNRCRIRQEKEICAMSLQILQQKCSVSHDQIETSLANWSQSPPTKFFGASPTTFSREINKGRYSLYYSPVFCFLSFLYFLREDAGRSLRGRCRKVAYSWDKKVQPWVARFAVPMGHFSEGKTDPLSRFPSTLANFQAILSN